MRMFPVLTEPLCHVHGPVLGILGPLRRGGCARYVGRFSPDAIATALREDASMSRPVWAPMAPPPVALSGQRSLIHAGPKPASDTRRAETLSAKLS